MHCCGETSHLLRQRRTMIERLMGVKEKYICRHCGKVLKIM